MSYTLHKKADTFHKNRHGIDLHIYPPVHGFEVAHINASHGHNQEFYHKESNFHYFIIEGSGSFFLNDEEISVTVGDYLIIEAGTRIYYTGSLQMLLITQPAWFAEGEVITREKIW